MCAIEHTDDAWLLVIDPQRVFADPTSDWCSPMFAATEAPISRLVERFGERTIVTRWLPGTDRQGSWERYFETFRFADVANTDPLFELIPAAQQWVHGCTHDVNGFGKWNDTLLNRVGAYPHLVLTGVSTDCCVISTCLAATDAGASVTVVSDACAGSTPENHAAALQVMSLYAPQVEIVTSEELLTRR